MNWLILAPNVTNARQVADMLGFLPDIIRGDDPRPAKEQINDRYSHSGGWNKFDGFTMDEHGWLHYPGDPPMKPIASTMLRDEHILFYEHDWLVIKQPNGDWEVSRMD